jgi:carbon-monoxide dehydrogenase large subunit
MTAASANRDVLTVLDRPNSYIGKVVPRPNLERLMQGRGLYVSDMELPRLAHVVFLRSPHAHAKIVGIDAVEARRMPGVIAVVTGKELATVITPWVGVLSHLKGLKSAPQHAICIRTRLLAGRSCRGGGGDQPCPGRGCGGNRSG